jgi:hypothetical protein
VAPETLPKADLPDLPAPKTLDAAQAGTLLRALSADADELSGMLPSADPDLMRSALKNPHLGEAHLLAILRRHSLPEGILRAISRVPQVAGSRRIKIALAGHHATPAPLLAQILGQLHLLELAEVLRFPGASPDHKAAAQQAILKRLPDTELGTKITLARRGTGAVLEALLAEGEPRLADAVLCNPALTEPNLLAFLRSPAASAESISALARHPRWGVRPKLRLAALKNRKTPAIWFTLFLPALGTDEVLRLLGSKVLAPRQLEAVQEELAKRGHPPRDPS